MVRSGWPVENGRDAAEIPDAKDCMEGESVDLRRYFGLKQRKKACVNLPWCFLCGPSALCLVQSVPGSLTVLFLTVAGASLLAFARS